MDKGLKELTPKMIGEHSIAFFAKYYLGISIPAHQMRWLSYIERKRHLQLSPRDHGKTTIFCYAFPLWKICYEMDVRILLVSKTNPQSKKLLDTIKKELNENPLILQDFGKLLEREGGTLWCKRSPKGRKLKDPTVEAVGAEGAITGGHFDIIICDDIVDDENVKTEARMSSLKNWFLGTIGELCEPSTIWLVSGTRKHYNDIYSELLENLLWQNIIDRAIIQYPEKWTYIKGIDESGKEYIIDVEIEGDSEVLWPEVWDIKTLLLNRQQAGSLLFDREKQNDPSGTKGQFLNVDWLHYFKWKDLPVEDLIFYVGGDLAISENEQADETVFVLIGYDRKNRRVYIIDFVAGRWDFPKQNKELISAYNKWSDMGMRASKVVLEDNVYQAALAQNIAATTWIPAIGRKTVKDKISKMLSITTHFENKSVMLRSSETNGIPEFRKQWVHFPYGSHDDMLDAVALVVLELALGGNSTLGVADPDSIYAEDSDYIFCGCGEEYGLKPDRLPKKNGICDVCGSTIKIIPKKVWEENV